MRLLLAASPLREPVCFNPRTHTRCDFTAVLRTTHTFFVSIHAPTRGATYRGGERSCRFVYGGFNPRTHTRCDTHIECLFHLPTQGFNPRTHTGCDDRRFKGRCRVQPGFNPRTHTRCDAIPQQDYELLMVSIHAPTRGATVCKVTYYKSIN